MCCISTSINLSTAKIRHLLSVVGIGNVRQKSHARKRIDPTQGQIILASIADFMLG